MGGETNGSQLTVVNDLPVYWLEGRDALSMGGLVFRVGTADERMQTHGLAHLVEHMALAIGEQTFTFNGIVNDTLTTMAAWGTPAELATFLNTVTARLSAPDLESIELHARVLRTEAEGGTTGKEAVLQQARFGPRGYGLRAYDELGLNWVGPKEVQAWIDRFYTAQNAFAFMTCPPPEGLNLGLPSGERIPPPTPNPLPLPYPIYWIWDANEVALSFLVDHSPATIAGMRILERALTQELRHRRGISYSVDLSIDRFTAELYHYILSADCQPASALAVRDHILSSIESMSRRGPDESELEWYAEAAANRDARDIPESGLLEEGGTHLIGGRFVPTDQFLEAVRKLTRQDVGEAVSRLVSTGILMAPEHLGPPAGWRSATSPLARRVHGKDFRCAKGQNPADYGRTLIVGSDGVSVVLVDEEVLTVLFAKCVCVGWSASGWRVLWGERVRIAVFPSHWKGGDEAIRMIDAAAPSDLFVPLEGAAPGPRVPGN